MRVLLATGITSEEDKLLQYADYHQCYNRSVVLDILNTIKPDVVVVSPRLKGIEDLMSSVIVPLREESIRVIFCPGDAHYDDARDWMRQLIGWGVYDYVYDPVSAEKILERIENPSKLGDLPKDIVSAVSKSDVTGFMDQLPEDNDDGEENLEKAFKNPFAGIKAKAKEKLTRDKPTKRKLQATTEGQPTNLPAIIAQKEKKPKAKTKPKWSLSFLNKMFVKTGYISKGKYIKYKASSIEELLKIDTPMDALVILKSFGVKSVKEYRRDYKIHTLPIIVLKGDQEYLVAGADRCVRDINSDVITDVTAYASRLRKLWASIEIDSLTGVYSRKFLNLWISERERQEQPFSVAILGLDKYKASNNTNEHSTSDVVLASFGEFLKSQTRSTDLVFRYSEDEFVIYFPFVNADEAKALVNWLREKWAKHVTLPSQVIQNTFSDGIAEWEKGLDVVNEADKILYMIKERGKNQIKAQTGSVILIGKLQHYATRLCELGIDIVSDPDEAGIVITDVASLAYIEKGKRTFVIGSGSVTDWAIQRERPDVEICASVDEIAEILISKKAQIPPLSMEYTLPLNIEPPREVVAKAPPAKNLTVLPGARTCSNNQTIPLHGALYVVCPSRPGLAGEMAVELSGCINNVALVCAAPESTAAVVMGIPQEKLICSDWRIPGSDTPIKCGEVMLWPIDPYKMLNISKVPEIQSLIDQIKHSFQLVIIDCGGRLDICSRVASDEGILVLYKDGDSADTVTSHWVKNQGGHNLLVMVPSEVPEIIQADNGFIIKNASLIASSSKI